MGSSWVCPLEQCFQGENSVLSQAYLPGNLLQFAVEVHYISYRARRMSMDPNSVHVFFWNLHFRWERGREERDCEFQHFTVHRKRVHEYWVIGILSVASFSRGWHLRWSHNLSCYRGLSKSLCCTRGVSYPGTTIRAFPCVFFRHLCAYIRRICTAKRAHHTNQK